MYLWADAEEDNLETPPPPASCEQAGLALFCLQTLIGTLRPAAGRIRPRLRLQAQVEVVGVHKPGAHAVDDPLTHRQSPPVQDPQGRLLVQSQVLDNRKR